MEFVNFFTGHLGYIILFLPEDAEKHSKKQPYR